MSEILLPGQQDDGSVIDKYGKVMPVREQLAIMERIGGLPVVDYRERVLATIRESRVTIIQAPTGSGKTTQIPKWLAVKGGFREKIVVTQPRRLAAVSNSSRVSQELLAEYGHPDFSLGEKVGYRTGTGVSSSRTSPLSFHTSGLELMREMFGKICPDILVMDEVHGFDVPTEFLGMMARETMRKTSSKMRLVLMSATLDPTIFQEYYQDIDRDIPVIQIPGRTYPVEYYYEDSSNITGTILDLFDKGENILVFASGKKEIDDIIASIKKILGEDAPVFPLHADMNKEDQQLLLTNKTGKPRIIVATNVAEESITIDYATVVIDLGRHKVSSYSHLGIPELRLRTISDANRLQRGGRVGRTSPGQAIWKNDTPVSELEPFSEAPIEKEMLDRYILLCLEDNKDIMELARKAKKEGKRLFFHDFDERLFQISLKRLEQLGAITHDRKITSFGQKLLTLPVDVYHAAILLESIQRGCTANMIYAVAILEKRGFLSKEDTWKEIKIPKTPEGDIFTYIEILKIVTSTKLTPKQLENLAYLGVNRESLESFQKGDGKYKLYELVDLSVVGIKNKNITEIDGLVEELREKFIAMDIPLVESKRAEDLKIALSAGSLHMVFRYDEETGKFYHRDHRGENPISFKQGNISVVNPREKSLYLGSPFIIGGSDGDLALVTFLTPVDEGHLKSVSKHLDALLMANERVSVTGPFTTIGNTGTRIKDESQGALLNPGDKKNTGRVTHKVAKTPLEEGGSSINISEGDAGDTPSPAEIAIDELTRSYAQGLEQYERGMEANTFETSESAQEYYLQHLLPDFMIAHNKSVQRYLADKSSDHIFIFRQLLIRVLQGEKSRIRTNSLARTEGSFRDDTSVMQIFEESKDPYIVAFRTGRPLPAAPKQNIVPVEIQETSRNIGDTAEVMGLRKKYAGLVGKLKGKRKKIDIDTLKKDLATRYFVYLDENSTTYGRLRDSFHVINGMEKGGLMDLIARLKRLKLTEEKIVKLRDKKGRLLSQEGEETKSDITRALAADIVGVDDEILNLLKKRNMKDMPLAKDVHESIARICVDFFEEEYARKKVLPHILEVTRQVVRDKITEKNGLNTILSAFFASKDLRRAKYAIGEYFEAVHDYANDIEIQGDSYEKEVYEEVAESNDDLYLQKMCDQIEKYIESSGRAKNNLSTMRDTMLFNTTSLDAQEGEFGTFVVGKVTIPKKRAKKVAPPTVQKNRKTRSVDTVKIAEITSTMQRYRKYYDDIQRSLIDQRTKIVQEQEYRKNNLVAPRSKYNKKTDLELKTLMEENKRLMQDTQANILEKSSTLLGNTPENVKHYKELVKKISQLPKVRL